MPSESESPVSIQGCAAERTGAGPAPGQLPDGPIRIPNIVVVIRIVSSTLGSSNDEHRKRIRILSFGSRLALGNCGAIYIQP